MTFQRSKHPDWDEIWGKVQNGNRYWLFNYIKSHDINQCTDESGNTLLHRAVQIDDKVAVSKLSLLCIDPNIENAAGKTAVQLARATQAQCFADLKERHLCINSWGIISSYNAMLASIYRGDAALENTSDVRYGEVHQGGWSALHCAAMYDRPHLIRALHKRFPYLDASYLNSNYHSALHIAAMYGHSNCIIALYECFPTIKVGAALQAACEYNHPACIPTLYKCFPRNGKYSSALLSAVKYNNSECIRALYSCFPDIGSNLPSDFGNTALTAAVQHLQDPNCISVLSDYFPDIDPNKALTYAIKEELSHSVILLCESFPNIDLNMQNSVLTFAVLNPGPLLSHLHKLFPNIDPNLQNSDGDTPLMGAICKNSDTINKRYEREENDDDDDVFKNPKTVKPQRPLPYCPVQAVRNFLDTFHNVNANIQNTKGETALTLAIEKRNVLLITLLLERFSDIQNSPNPAGKTALVLALETSQLEVLSLLLNHIIQVD